MAHRAGIVAVIGQPNVGKSTLINALVGHKVSIVSSKPQTTRRRVLGIAQTADYQIAFVDTPGIHEPHTKLGRAMVEQARGSLADVDAVLIVADGSRKPNEIDEKIAKLVSRPKQERKSPRSQALKTEPAVDSQQPNGTNNQEPETPIILCLNKMDLLKPDFVVENTEAFSKLFGTDKWMLTTATKGENLDKLMEMLLEAIPEGEVMFPEDEYTDQTTRFMVAELIREKVLLATKQEVPHSTAVRVERWEDQDGRLEIGAAVIVEKSSQRAILIGKKGQFVRQIGTDARKEIEELIGRHIYLDLHVVVREDWRQNPRMLRELEYTE